jgi:hypothetical protein
MLAPGESVRGEVDLRCAVQAVASPASQGQELYRFDSLGEYRISMRYSYRCEDAPCPVGTKMETLTAPEFRIEVK